jgi:endogenous inhibitor of DNA gyrase (YacG/DUF329 family)
MIDLGRWLDGTYTITDDIIVPASDGLEDAAPQE